MLPAPAKMLAVGLRERMVFGLRAEGAQLAEKLEVNVLRQRRLLGGEPVLLQDQRFRIFDDPRLCWAGERRVPPLCLLLCLAASACGSRPVG